MVAQNTQSGFTLVELMIVMAIVGIFISLVVGVGSGLTDSNSSVSFGFNGMTEVRCINGYQFVIGSRGGARQILDEFGKGAKCNKGAQ
jgi:prepilin-type N-terminal cleavage/methylation domain-containing protein